MLHSPKSVRCRKTVYIDSMFVFLVICFAYRSVEKNPTNVWSNDYKISDKTSLIKVGVFFRFKKLAIDPVQGYQFMRALMGINTTDY